MQAVAARQQSDVGTRQARAMVANPGSRQAAMTAVRVSLATPDDVPELITLFWDAFSGPAESTFPHTDGGRMWLERSFQNFLGGKSYYRPESRVPVVRNANGMLNWPSTSKLAESNHDLTLICYSSQCLTSIPLFF